MKEDWISSSITTGSMRSIESANVSCLPLVPCRSSGVDERFLRVLLDELAAGFDVLAHEDAEHPVRRRRVLRRPPSDMSGGRKNQDCGSSSWGGAPSQRPAGVTPWPSRSNPGPAPW